MKARLWSLSPRAVFALTAAAVLVYAAAGWFVVLSPKRAEVSRLDADLVAAEAQLAAAKAAASQPSASAPVPVADVLRLVKAMPASGDQAGLVLELSALAMQSGVTLGSISPAEAVTPPGGVTMIPVTVTVTGTYFKIAKFLQRTRGLVVVRSGSIKATGRLFAVRSVNLVESKASGFPRLDGTIALSAYVYDGPITPPAPAEKPDDTSEPTGSAAAGRTS